MARVKVDLKDEYAAERKLFGRWSRWRFYSDTRDIHRICGLTSHGSPVGVMKTLWDRGAPKIEDVTGYAAPAPPITDGTLERVDALMVILGICSPEAYDAVLARHCRIVHGERSYLRSEGGMALVLYNIQNFYTALKRLEHDCQRAYAALRRWLALGY